MEIQEYIDAVPEARKEKLISLIELIRSACPNAKESIQYKMPMFTHGQNWIAVANQKNYISLYTCNADSIKPFKVKNPNIKTGKGCINFTDSGKIPRQDVEQLIIKVMHAGY